MVFPSTLKSIRSFEERITSTLLSTFVSSPRPSSLNLLSPGSAAVANSSDMAKKSKKSSNALKEIPPFRNGAVGASAGPTPDNPNAVQNDVIKQYIQALPLQQSTSGTGGRHRRSDSVTTADEILRKDKKERAAQPDHPIHRPQDSLLSFSSGYTNYRGLLNLCILLLVLSNTRAALENLIKYGILVNPVGWMEILIRQPSNWTTVHILLSLNIYIISSLIIEKLLASRWIGEVVGKIAIVINVTCLLVIPPAIVYTSEANPVGTSMALGLVSTLFLKLVSYHMTNYWCRMKLLGAQSHKPLKSSGAKGSGAGSKAKSKGGQRATSATRERANTSDTEQNGGLRRRQNATAATTPATNDSTPSTTPSSTPTPTAAPPVTVDYSCTTPKLQTYIYPKVTYPNNLRLGDIYYFFAAPTLCYELSFPRSQRIRKRFLLRRVLEMFILLQLILGLIQQWIVPTVNNSLTPLVEMNLFQILERLLKLAVPNHVIWLLFFYWYFHSCMNSIAEVLRFADREFYRDWWNSESVYYFWQNWNIPVHRWCVRHLYIPLIHLGVSKFQASTAVFLVSAFFHEYLVSVPLKMFRLWAFSGMMMQIPLAMLVERYLQNKQYANMAVWLSLIIGQPLSILMYYHDYYVINTLRT